jgi:hypothetical protein
MAVVKPAIKFREDILAHGVSDRGAPSAWRSSAGEREMDLDVVRTGPVIIAYDGSEVARQATIRSASRPRGSTP